MRTGEEASEEVVDGVGELAVAAVRLQVHLPPDGDAVHVDLHEKALLLASAAAAAAGLASVPWLWLGRRRFGRGRGDVPPE